MQAILDKLNIDETFTKPVKKSKVFTSVYDNVPHVEHYNYMMDLLMLPETKKGYRYLLVCVDLGNSEFDIEPMKNKQPDTVLEAFKVMFKRPYIKKPYASVQTDAGTEFKGVFQKWMYDESILHKTAVPDRHSQMSSVENLNRNLGRFLNGYMNSKEQQTGKVYREWTDVLGVVREMYNKYRKRKTEDIHKQKFQSELPIDESNFKVGDVVYYISQIPLNALGQAQPTKTFRMGDRRWNINAREVTHIYAPMGRVPYRYGLKGLSNVSYTDNELMLADSKKHSTYTVKDIIGKRRFKGRVQYLVWFKDQLKKNASWESRASLIEDDLIEYIKRYEKEQKDRKKAPEESTKKTVSKPKAAKQSIDKPLLRRSTRPRK